MIENGAEFVGRNGGIAAKILLDRELRVESRPYGSLRIKNIFMSERSKPTDLIYYVL